MLKISLAKDPVIENYCEGEDVDELYYAASAYDADMKHYGAYWKAKGVSSEDCECDYDNLIHVVDDEGYFWNKGEVEIEL